MPLRVLYLARLRDALGVATESVPVPVPATVTGLLAHLHARGAPWSEALGAVRAFKVALNHEIVSLDAALTDGDEVAFLPPVTGG